MPSEVAVLMYITFYLYYSIYFTCITVSCDLIKVIHISVYKSFDYSHRLKTNSDEDAGDGTEIMKWIDVCV